VLGRVTKTVQPSSISSHIPSHHDQHQGTIKKGERRKKIEKEAGKLENSKEIQKIQKFQSLFQHLH
jgi:hypothetical protein